MLQLHPKWYWNVTPGTIHTPNCAQVGFLTPVTCTLAGGTLYTPVERGVNLSDYAKEGCVCMYVI